MLPEGVVVGSYPFSLCTVNEAPQPGHAKRERSVFPRLHVLADDPPAVVMFGEEGGEGMACTVLGHGSGLLTRRRRQG